MQGNSNSPPLRRICPSCGEAYVNRKDYDDDARGWLLAIAGAGRRSNVVLHVAENFPTRSRRFLSPRSSPTGPAQANGQLPGALRNPRNDALWLGPCRRTGCRKSHRPGAEVSTAIVRSGDHMVSSPTQDDPPRLGQPAAVVVHEDLGIVTRPRLVAMPTVAGGMIDA